EYGTQPFGTTSRSIPRFLDSSKQLLHRGIQVAEGLIDGFIARRRLGVGRGGDVAGDGGFAGGVYVAPDTCAYASQQRRAIGGPFGRLRSQERHVEHVGEDLLPQRTACAAARDAHLGGGGD